MLKLKLFFDQDIFFAQKNGGISTYFRQILHYTDVFDFTKVYKPLDSLYIPFKLRSLTLLLSFVRPLFSKLTSKIPIVYHQTYYRNILSLVYPLPIVVTVHDMTHETSPYLLGIPYLRLKLFSFLKFMMISRADHIICVSNSTRSDLLSVYPWAEQKNISVIHHGCDHLKYNLAKPLTADITSAFNIKSNFILFVGSRSKYKGFDILLNAFNDFRFHNPDYIVVCVGAPFSATELSLIEGYNLTSYVNQVSCSDLQLAALYQSAFALIYPSQAEGFGLPILEAMFNECPVLCSSIPVHREIATNHAFFFDPLSPLDLLRALNYLKSLSSTSLDYHIQEAKHYSSNFTWEKTAKETFLIYRSLITS